MGCRRQPRIPISLTATVCGMDAKGRSFLDRVRVLNLSRNGALLEDVSCAVSIGNIVALRCEGTMRRYRVKWEQSTSEGRRIGLVLAAGVPAITSNWLPDAAADDYIRPRMRARRAHARHSCEIAVEIRLRDVSTPMWVTACDLGESGCRVLVPHAMNPGTEADVALWLDGERVWLQGEVTHSLYGCGTGIRFTKMDRVAEERIANLLAVSETIVSDRRETEAQQEEFYPAFYATS